MTVPAGRFAEAQMHVVRWAAAECERQRSGERSVAWMLAAWDYAMVSWQADVALAGASWPTVAGI